MTAGRASSGAKCRCRRIAAAGPPRRTSPRCACSFAIPPPPPCTPSTPPPRARSSRPPLRHPLEKARAANPTEARVTPANQRGRGEREGVSYDEVRYEGYGPGGAAVLLDCLTDNRTRTVAEVRHAFSKNGGNLGSDGSVAYLFKHCGQFIFAPGTSEDKVMEAGLQARAGGGPKKDHQSLEAVFAPAHL